MIVVERLGLRWELSKKEEELIGEILCKLTKLGKNRIPWFDWLESMEWLKLFIYWGYNMKVDLVRWGR